MNSQTVRRLLGLTALASMLGLVTRWAAGAGLVKPPPLGTDRGLDQNYLSACVGDFIDSFGNKSQRYFHWNAEDFPLRVRVTAPPGMPPAAAEERHEAVVAGIRSWQERVPDLIRLHFVSDSSPAQIAPGWIDHFGTDIGGQCYYAVEERGGGYIHMRITTFDLAVRKSPQAKSFPNTHYSVEELKRTAAHEMGHALGLGHSRRRSDIMFPDFTDESWSISARDIRTLRQLYALPNGTKAM